jgi:NADPH:quinone reductase-like Zn-dependent oxidoreductase
LSSRALAESRCACTPSLARSANVPFLSFHRFGLQFAVASGATVIVTSSSDPKLTVAQKLGAKHLINYNTTPDWDIEVRKITKGEGADHVLEVGGVGTLEKSMRAVRTAGWIQMIGVLAKTDKPTDIVSHILGNGLGVRGVKIGSVKQ